MDTDPMMPRLDRPRLYVDFNERLEPDLFLLSRDDQKRDSSGAVVTLTEGMLVFVYSDDADERNQPDPLIAEGTVERNPGDQAWSAAAKWCCRIRPPGIRSASVEVAASKDESSQQPIATRWRPTLRLIVSRFVAGDFELEGIPGVEPVSAAKAAQMRDYVADYGETLIPLPEETWATSVAMWMGGDWHALVDLWTAESGGSDMVLDLDVHETDDGFRFHVHLVYVP